MLKNTTIFIRSSRWDSGLKRLSQIHNKGQTCKTVCFFFKLNLIALLFKHWTIGFLNQKKKKGIEPLTLEKLICISLKSEAWLAMYQW